MVLKKTLKRRGGGCHVFPSELFCLIVPKNVVGEPFVFQKFSGREKIKIKKAVSRLSVDNFLYHMPNTFWVHTFVFWKMSGRKKNMSYKWGVSRFSVEIFLSHTVENFRVEPLNVSQILGYRNGLWIIGGITIFCPKFLVSYCRQSS